MEDEDRMKMLRDDMADEAEIVQVNTPEVKLGGETKSVVVASSDNAENRIDSRVDSIIDIYEATPRVRKLMDCIVTNDRPNYRYWAYIELLMKIDAKPLLDKLITLGSTDDSIQTRRIEQYIKQNCLQVLGYRNPNFRFRFGSNNGLFLYSLYNIFHETKMSTELETLTDDFTGGFQSAKSSP
jgi:hypothetical protein